MSVGFEWAPAEQYEFGRLFDGDGLGITATVLIGCAVVLLGVNRHQRLQHTVAGFSTGLVWIWWLEHLLRLGFLGAASVLVVWCVTE